jgi:hypothetical protein
MGSDPSPKCTARDRRGRVSVPDLAVAETKIQSSKHKLKRWPERIFLGAQDQVIGGHVADRGLQALVPAHRRHPRRIEGDMRSRQTALRAATQHHKFRECDL